MRKNRKEKSIMVTYPVYNLKTLPYLKFIDVPDTSFYDEFWDYIKNQTPFKVSFGDNDITITFIPKTKEMWNAITHNLKDETWEDHGYDESVYHYTQAYRAIWEAQELLKQIA